MNLLKSFAVLLTIFATSSASAAADDGLADIHYDPATGDVRLENIDGAGFPFLFSGGPFFSGSYATNPDQVVTIVNVPTLIFALVRVDPSIQPHISLGPILPVGLNEQGLSRSFTSSSYVGSQPLNLIIVPEPASLGVLAIVGGLVLARRRRGIA